MYLPKLYEKSEYFILPDGTKGVYIAWVDKDGKEHGVHTCSDCDDPMFSGHVINDGDEYYCTDCINKHYTSEQLAEMYEADEQYYTEWDESDLKEDFILVYEEEALNLADVSKTFALTENTSVVVTFEKIANETLFYTMQISGIKVHLTAEPSKKPTEEELISFKLSDVDIATETYYKLLMVDELVQLSKIYYLVECETGEFIADITKT
ncbi:hypothetical protein ABD87_15000 [Lysinibacillus sphaericus]|uniref:hypothetical protein n=1 Tax=Lysinibacillus sphaericus TaxID=1421 RepID=UPI0018CFD326|nr:hypothetical protein [Lysinibacillus sphaericus]MBG9730800.1 hypothetical protein [Lysinibacillus sphaericus]